MAKQKEKYICEICHNEFKPLSPKAKLCYSCFKHSKKYKRKIVQPRLKIPKINKQLNEIQTINRPLSQEEKAEIAFMLGRYSTIKEIQTYYKTKDKGKEINYESIKSIRDSDRWKPIIEKERSEWLSKIKDVPISNKRVRMEGWQTMMEIAYKDEDMKVLKQSLEGARNEMEGIHIGVPGGNQYSLTYIAQMSGNELLQKRDELMSKIKRITKSVEQHKESDNVEIAEIQKEEDILNENSEQSSEG